MKVKITKAKPVVQPPDTKEFIFSEREATFIRDVLGGLSDIRVQTAVQDSFNFGKFGGDEVVELKDHISSFLTANLASLQD